MKKSLFAILPFLGACAGQPPSNIGVQNGELTACPESPNCVSSFASSEQHGIAPLGLTHDGTHHRLKFIGTVPPPVVSWEED